MMFVIFTSKSTNLMEGQKNLAQKYQIKLGSAETVEPTFYKSVADWGLYLFQKPVSLSRGLFEASLCKGRWTCLCRSDKQLVECLKKGNTT